MVHSPAGWRVVVNSVAATVCRCPNLEAALTEGRAFKSAGDVEQVLATDIRPINDIRSTARYRLRVLSRLVYHKLTGGPLA
jgi:CO/xanthine dehydrogenase FAD-binding subunit